MGDILNKRAGDSVEAIWRHGRRRATFAQSIGGGFYANVVDGVLVGFGVEPVAGPFVAPLPPVAITPSWCGRPRSPAPPRPPPAPWPPG